MRRSLFMSNKRKKYWKNNPEWIFSCITWVHYQTGLFLSIRGNWIDDSIVVEITEKNELMATKKTVLTEQELLAMPEEDYMDDRQLAFFRCRLQQMEAELRGNADQTTEHLRETVIVPDPADRATIEEEHALELRTRDRERKLLKKVQAAIQRIDSGDYGWCEETGEPIGVGRLLARPTATLCLEAQLRREIRQKMYGE